MHPARQPNVPRGTGHGDGKPVSSAGVVTHDDEVDVKKFAADLESSAK
jgi:hypothetical protein